MAMTTEKKVLRALKEYYKKHNISPSIRELVKLSGIRSTSTVHQHLTNLERRGYISIERRCHRSISLIKK
ncbi:transcriptional regulator [Alkaliphilus pronyensis]|uniref:Transcriptional regulator n=1 Tax=Alkaliphilus pronyensis TaxID=1482732 RepID=A0A6I0FCE8_9FIRM|nr:transcriptional regulator [Alkaliphilus pronyensis]KAB3535625.1 transcriptional regulator [Alkaliphilus pronyensis]